MNHPWNTNLLNRLRYTIYTPFYDWVGRYFSHSRKRNLDQLGIFPDARVLIVGAGTGLDLEFLPSYCTIVATDITPSMVDRIRQRNKHLDLPVEGVVMDGQRLDFPDKSFDFVILHLILAVIPDPIKCIQEAERVLKPGGKISVLDKFIISGRKPSGLRRFLNIFSSFLFSDITRSFEKIISHTKLSVLQDEHAHLNGFFRRLILEKK